MDRQNYSYHDSIQSFLNSLQNLSQLSRKNLQNSLSTQPIKKAFIRDVILKENQTFPKGFLLLDGEVKISKHAGDKNIVFASLGINEIVNIEYPLYGKVNYTVTVNSSSIKFIVLSAECLRICFNSLEESIRQRESLHKKEVQVQEKQKEKKEKNKKHEVMIKRLSLPNINVSQTKLKKKKSVQISKEPIPPFFTYESDQLNKEKSIKIMKNSERMKSFASQEKLKSNDDRHEKLFKEHLKSIIKRKLIYEKKQLGVLQAFRHDIEKVIKHDNYHLATTEGNDIDSYFKV